MGPRRGEIYFVDLGPPRGREQAFQRPVVVLSIDSYNQMPLVVVVVPGTKGAEVATDYQSDLRVPPTDAGLPLETVFKCLQLTAVDVRKFPAKRAGRLSGRYLALLEDKVRHVLGL